MFDTFEPFLEIRKQNFTFKPTRYEIWKAGKIVFSGNTSAVISANVVSISGSDKVEVSFDDFSLRQEMSQLHVFDKFVTGIDRLQLLVIPEETNVESPALTIYKELLGSTRKKKHFTSREAFCCNLFLQNGNIAKVSCIFCNPEKVIDFY